MFRYIIVSIFILLGPAHSASKKEVIISSAISFKECLKSLRDQFEKKHPAYKVHLNFSSTGTLRQQIEAGAPVDLFISASKYHQEKLVKRSLVSENSIEFIANNRLVLVSSKDYALDLKSPTLIDENIKRIVIGRPSHVPLGQYSLEYLKSSSQYTRLQNKLIYGDHARQVLSYIINKEAQLGIIYLSEFNQHKSILKKVSLIPSEMHSDIHYTMAPLTSSTHKNFHKSWSSFLKTPEAINILTQYRFL